MSKPRQFWCDQSGTLDNGKVLRFEAHQEQPKCWQADKSRSFHLIEFSAYQSAIEELKAAREALDTCYMQFADRIARVKAPESYMLEECQQARLRIDKFLKENE